MKDEKIYTIDDVARALGISKTTVSRALSGKGRISKRTVERVQSFIAEHDFNPSVLARGLAQNKTYNLALILPADYMEHDVAFFKECVVGICRVAAAWNYDVTLAMVEGQLENMIANRKVDGVLFSRSVANDPVPEWLAEKGIPFVLIGTSAGTECPSVDNPNREAGQELTRRLLAAGARRPALLGGNSSHQVTVTRCRGFLDACAEFQMKEEDMLVYQNLDYYPQVREAVAQALSAGTDTLVCMDDYICNLALMDLYERHLDVPGQIQVASMYDNFLLESRNPPVTAVQFTSEQLGARACKLLLRLLGEEIPEETDPDPAYRILWRKSTR